MKETEKHEINPLRTIDMGLLSEMENGIAVRVHANELNSLKAEVSESVIMATREILSEPLHDQGKLNEIFSDYDSFLKRWDFQMNRAVK